MKKLLFAFLALAIATPVWALTVTAVDEGSGVVRIDYTMANGEKRVRAFGLDITIASPATIDTISDYKTDGQSISTSKGYGIYPSNIVIDGNGIFQSSGSPVSPNAKLPAGTQPGLGTQGVTIELGSLFAPTTSDANAPLLNTGGTLTLCKLHCTSHGAGTAALTIALNSARGGIVFEDTTVPTSPTLTGTTVTFATAPLAPTPVAASQATSATIITVTWGASAGATGYDVYKSFTNDSATATLVGTGNQTSPFSYSAGTTQTNAEGRTTYFWVKAKNAIGSSPFSAGASGWVNECIKSTSGWVAIWRTFGRPNCWAFQRNCRGDADGLGTGLTNKVYVNSTDLSVLAAAFNKTQSQLIGPPAIAYNGVLGICADNDRLGTGLTNKVYVNSTDLGRLATYFNLGASSVPVCGTLAGETTWYSSNINWWKN